MADLEMHIFKCGCRVRWVHHGWVCPHASCGCCFQYWLEQGWQCRRSDSLLRLHLLSGAVLFESLRISMNGTGADLYRAVADYEGRVYRDVEGHLRRYFPHGTKDFWLIAGTRVIDPSDDLSKLNMTPETYLQIVRLTSPCGWEFSCAHCGEPKDYSGVPTCVCISRM